MYDMRYIIRGPFTFIKGIYTCALPNIRAEIYPLRTQNVPFAQ